MEKHTATPVQEQGFDIGKTRRAPEAVVSTQVSSGCMETPWAPEEHQKHQPTIRILQNQPVCFLHGGNSSEQWCFQFFDKTPEEYNTLYYQDTKMKGEFCCRGQGTI